ncbi:Mitochondrial substrate carrier family protein isoform 1 [Hibiscus syriacus]|uniref:Mitochondrial substrate carrier family protein isoform 1 n=1 Tax=Hibiscus syriacus TaxID=106335 RepID=A0A6A2YBL5_HIBSY|nr:Mitochondrial substrate carrier family protein isoform 1 [Hibiscus syriacus]
MPLVSNLDHLDFMMQYLEGKISLQKGMEKACLPLDLAMREAYFKVSLLDRVTSLENRLFQLCLDMESSSTLSTYASSIQGSRVQPIPQALPTFANSNKLHKEEARGPLLSRSEIQEESETMLLQKKKIPNPLKHKRICSKSGKKVSPKWLHWKILGC